MELFVYGTLMVPEVMHAVCGHAAHGRPGVLHGYRRRKVAGEVYPAMVASAGDAVEGLLYHGLSAEQFAALDDFEGAMYRRSQVTVMVGRLSRLAVTYLLAPAYRQQLSDEPWSLEEFRQQDLAAFLSGYRGFIVRDRGGR